MFWEEKIDRLKNKYSPEEFHVPFNDWSSILKKIEQKFIIKKNSRQYFNYWAENIKSPTLIKAIPKQNLHTELDQLNPHIKYWIVIVFDENSSSTHYLYEGKIQPIKDLLRISHNTFYLIDKKYEWLLYFHRLKDEEEVSIYRSGIGQSHYENHQ